MVAAALALATGTGTFAQGRIEFEEYDLDNGLHVILHQDKSTPIVAISVLYHVGSKNEDPGKTGFAHFFEHLLFEGSENIGRGEYMSLVQSNGGALNANTTNDRTFYYEILPSNQLELGLWMESERMLHAKIDQVGVDTQREVVKEERRQRYENRPYGSFLEKMFMYSFPEYVYEWTPIGSMEDLNSAKLEDFLDFYKRFYSPNNATLSIAGDIDIEKTKELIAKYFADIPKGPEVVQPTMDPKPLAAEKREVVPDNVQLPGLFIGYRVPKETNDDAYALQMLSRVLSDGQSSRLYKKMVDQDQSAVQVAAFNYGLENAGLFITVAIANMGKDIDSLEATINQEIERIKTELISEKEYEKVLNSLENDFVTSNSRMAGIAESLANYHVYYGNTNLINTEIERYRKVSREDIQRVAKEYLNKDNRVVLIYVPKEKEQNP
ncbi:MAG: insulinase family protein [Bacteroidota bacterium]|nr:insulinase family protein [Bacteroidota bacterium]